LIRLLFFVSNAACAVALAAENPGSTATNVADSPAPPQAATDPAEADEDFAIQGEYATAGDAPQAGGRWGLQVVALGGGKFDAVLLQGGLPGDGWDRAARLPLAGQRGAQWLDLEGSGYRVRIAQGEAKLADGADHPLAVLRKVQRTSPTEGAPPPPGALVLFDGKSVDQFVEAKMTADGLLEAGALTKVGVGDFHLHLEFRTPYMPAARGQGRGNSGVYIQQRYEVQILDSFGLPGEANECGGVYKQHAPEINMCFPPLAWQTYDIDFTAARWNRSGKKIADARITVLQNGVPVQLHYAISDKTGAGKAEGPEIMPILLQNHNNPVRFRNVWIDLHPPVAKPHAAPQRCGHRRWPLRSCGLLWRLRNR
jgi:hypothetical protein